MTTLGMTQDPIRFAKTFWPSVDFYDRQRDLIYSVRDNDETFVGGQ